MRVANKTAVHNAPSYVNASSRVCIPNHPGAFVYLVAVLVTELGARVPNWLSRHSMKNELSVAIVTPP